MYSNYSNRFMVYGTRFYGYNVITDREFRVRGGAGSYLLMEVDDFRIKYVPVILKCRFNTPFLNAEFLFFSFFFFSIQQLFYILPVSPG